MRIDFRTLQLCQMRASTRGGEVLRTYLTYTLRARLFFFSSSVRDVALKISERSRAPNNPIQRDRDVDRKSEGSFVNYHPVRSSPSGSNLEIVDNPGSHHYWLDHRKSGGASCLQDRERAHVAQGFYSN